MNFPDGLLVKTAEAGGPRGYAAEKMVNDRRDLSARSSPHSWRCGHWSPGWSTRTQAVRRQDGAPLRCLQACAVRSLAAAVMSSLIAPRPGDKLRKALENPGTWTIEIVKRFGVAKGPSYRVVTGVGSAGRRSRVRAVYPDVFSRHHYHTTAEQRACRWVLAVVRRNRTSSIVQHGMMQHRPMTLKLSWTTQE